MVDMSRRAMLRLGGGAAVGLTGALALGGVFKDRSETQAATAAPEPPAPPPVEPPLPARPSPLSAPAPTVVRGSFVSAARGGVETNWAIVRPPGQIAALRPVIALHGTGADAAAVVNFPMAHYVADAVNAGAPPFAVVAVDGGDGFWHKRASGGDSGAMVLDELIPMLGSQGLDTSRVAFWGWSMGGYGALLLGARLGPARTAAISALSPGLWPSFNEAPAGAFDSAADFAANTVYGLPALASIPIRIDMGTSDSLYPGAQTFIAQLPTRPAGGNSPGGHDFAFWSSQLPAELGWIAPLLAA
jgi:predicted esterase